MFIAEAVVTGIEDDRYVVLVNGGQPEERTFRVAKGGELRIGIALRSREPGCVMQVPVEMPVVYPGNPNLFVAFSLSGAQLQGMVDEGLALRFATSETRAPLVLAN